VPERLADCGLELPLSVMDKEAARAPVAVGVKVTFTVHELDTAKVAGLTGQLFVWAKSPAFVPESPTLDIVSRPGPLLVTVIDCDALAVP